MNRGTTSGLARAVAVAFLACCATCAAAPAPDRAVSADRLDWVGLALCEAGGRPHAIDPSGTYGGLYQFDLRTWHALGGHGRPQDAPAAEQTRRAKRLFLRRGTQPWPACGVRLLR